MKIIKLIMLCLLLLFTISGEYKKLKYNKLFVKEEQFYLDCYKTLKRNPGNPDYLKTHKKIKRIVLPYLQRIRTPKEEESQEEQSEQETPNLTPNELYILIIDLYTHFSFYKNGINPYHNVCHGFMTMIISGKLFLDYKGYENLEEEPDINIYRIILFAGLMHDVAHPGVGNEVINIPRIKEIYLNRFESYDEGSFKYLKFEFGGRDFVLEEIHNFIAIYFVDLFLHDLGGEMNKLLTDSIMNTNMDHHFDFESWDDVSHINLIVHFADIAGYGSKNEELIQHLAVSCIEEFFYESYFVKNSGLCSKDLQAKKALSDEKIIENIVSKQIFFLDEVLIGKIGKFPKISALDFLPIVIDRLNNNLDKESKEIVKSKIYQEMDNIDFQTKEIFIQEYFLFNMYQNSSKLSNFEINFDMIEFANINNTTKNTFKNIHKVCSSTNQVLTRNLDITTLVNTNTTLLEEIFIDELII